MWAIIGVDFKQRCGMEAELFHCFPTCVEASVSCNLPAMRNTCGQGCEHVSCAMLAHVLLVVLWKCCKRRNVMCGGFVGFDIVA